jgi:hypothetical protein
MKSMRLVAPLLCAFLSAASGYAQSMPANNDPKLEALQIDLRTLARIAEVAKELEQNRQVMAAVVDSEIEALREPRGDGSYRWASLQREEDGRVTEETTVQKVSTEAKLDTDTVSAPRAYRLEVSVPKKRNLVSDNQRVYVRSASVDWTSLDGKVSHTDLPIDVWVTPGDAHSVALPDIARSAKATVELGVDSGNKKAVAKVSLIQAKLVDDPASANFPAVTRLLNMKRLIAEDRIRRGDLKSAVDEAILTLPGELERRNAAQAEAARQMRSAAESGTLRGTIALGDATPDVVAELTTIGRLASGTLEEQTQARSRLQELIEKLSPAPKPQQ